ncbi:hypothetical protein [Miniphocaeibacter massiliensis]|uniref:hypothetical protein n=1 Tax=Miniphocaeibacter massiliensis TaxID=2041841 RepID=UPI000C1C4130|nr:hypothetical protein [Miniphocaeibacter massiliensis]
MKNILKMELNKGIKNKFFVLSIAIGVFIAVWGFLYNYYSYTDQIELMESLKLKDPSFLKDFVAERTVFNSWIGGEAFSLASVIYFFVFPILIAIPYGWSYAEEKNSGYVKNIVVKTGKKNYFFAKYISVFITGGLAMVLPLILNFLMIMLFIPSITPLPEYLTSYGVVGGDIMAKLYYTKPFLYVFLYLCVDFLYCGILACISLAATSFIKQKWAVVIIPFFYCLAIEFSTKFVYTNLETSYKEISPFYFLKPVTGRYQGSWIIILVSGFLILTATLGITMVLERKREIY